MTSDSQLMPEDVLSNGMGGHLIVEEVGFRCTCGSRTAVKSSYSLMICEGCGLVYDARVHPGTRDKTRAALERALPSG